jgi:DNA-binding protein H-NS
MASDTIAKLAEEIAKLQAKLDAEKNKERGGALEEARKLVADYSFTSEELGIVKPMLERVKFTRKPPRPKYENPADRSETWSGRGKPPRFFKEQLAKGRKIEEFLIKA